MNNIILKLEPFAMYVPFLIPMAIPYYFMIKARDAIPETHRDIKPATNLKSTPYRTDREASKYSAINYGTRK